MKTARKAILLVLCAVLLVVSAVTGTLAYLTADDAVTNTFTVGKVEMTLDEAKTNEYGVVDTTATTRVKANEYKLIPGHTYSKDPIVHMVSGSEDSWVFVKVENGLAGASGIEAESETEANGYKSIHDQILANGWAVLTGEENVYYKAWAKTDAVDLAVFEEFKIDGEKAKNGTDGNIEDFATVKENGVITGGAFIKVTAYAIQQDGFNSDTKTDAENAAAAWDALSDQLNLS